MPPPAFSPDTLRSRYRRLPGRMSTLRLLTGASSILSLGDDHLLQVIVSLYTERYQRFSYTDIQALLLRETARGLVYNVILGTLAAGCGLLGWSNEDAGYTRPVFFGLGAFWLVLLAVNLGFGKTCRCQLQTAAGPHPLPSLNRLRLARKAFRLITEKVEAAQIHAESA